jgi:hypothetical protein
VVHDRDLLAEGFNRFEAGRRRELERGPVGQRALQVREAVTGLVDDVGRRRERHRAVAVRIPERFPTPDRRVERAGDQRIEELVKGREASAGIRHDLASAASQTTTPRISRPAGITVVHARLPLRLHTLGVSSARTISFSATRHQAGPSASPDVGSRAATRNRSGIDGWRGVIPRGNARRSQQGERDARRRSGEVDEAGGGLRVAGPEPARVRSGA